MTTPQLDLERLSGKDGSPAVTRLQGKLSIETVHNFIHTQRAEPAAHLAVDMGGVTFLDSAGVGALVQIFVHRRNQGKTFALARLTKQGSAVMQVAGLTKLLPIYSSVEEALAHSKIGLNTQRADSPWLRINWGSNAGGQ